MSLTTPPTVAAPYIGRFAPSPTGPLHAGSLVAAMASFLDAKVHDGKWLLRIEDVDQARTVPGAAESIQHTLQALGMQWDGEVVWQSHRAALYQAALDQLQVHVYPCSCSRREIADSSVGVGSDGAAIYPGTCRHGLANGKNPRAHRLRVPDAGAAGEVIVFADRWVGPQTQHLATDVGDFVLKRADGFWSYQLAVVVDDAEQGVTHVVRGADLLHSTVRQIYLLRLLQRPVPQYLHVPVVSAPDGEKLSKQTTVSGLDVQQPLLALHAAAAFLGLEIGPVNNKEDFWVQARAAWAKRFASQ